MESSFQIIDYVVFVGVLIVSMLIGAYFSFKGNKSPEEFLMGNRNFGPVPIAMSLLTSYVSAISLLGFSGEAYAYGIQIILFLVGTLIGIVMVIIIIVPVLYPLKLTSVNEYIESRFNSPALAKTTSLISCLTGLFYMGSCLYAPTIALAVVTPISSLTYIFVLGIVVTIYSSIGGIKAVVWTDVFQLSIMLVGLVVIAIAGLVDVGGFSNVWTTSLAGGRLDIGNTNPSFYERHNIYNTIAFGFFHNSAFFGVSQINVQRICSVRTIADARKILWINAAGMVIIYVLIFGGGLIAYTAYFGCDPWLLQLINKKDEIMPHYVVNRLSFVMGLPGLFVATLIGGALSSLSSVMNAIVAMVWQDYCLKYKIFANVKPITATVINKLFSFAIGGFIIGAAVVASNASNLIQFSLSVTGAMFGGIFGVFLLGFLFPKTNLKGVWTGLITSLLLMGWLSGGAFLYGKSTSFLPFSADQCPAVGFNSTQFASDKNLYLTQNQRLTTIRTFPQEDDSAEDFPLMWLYGVSYTLYAGIGCCVCMGVAIIVSFFTGNLDISEVSPEYVTPLVRPLYWKKETLEKFRMEKENLEIKSKIIDSIKIHKQDVGNGTS